VSPAAYGARAPRIRVYANFESVASYKQRQPYSMDNFLFNSACNADVTAPAATAVVLFA
jgi:hypothetical protein